MNISRDQKHPSLTGEGNARAFIEYLEYLAGYEKSSDEKDRALDEPTSRPDRAALAHLRRTLGKKPDQAFGAFPYLVSWTENLSDWHEECYYLVASLFAMYPSRSWHHTKEETRRAQRNFGASFLWLDKEMQIQSQTDERSKSLERRFTALLMSQREDLPERMRHAISLLKSYKVQIDWVQLLDDLRWWEQSERAYSSRNPTISPQRRWAKSFWRVSAIGSVQIGNDAADATQDNQSHN
jgi:CRISPR system Cascade subunit CasB